MSKTASILTVCLLGALGASSVHAEVSARVDRRGSYAGTVVVPAGTQNQPRVWTPRSRHADRRGISLGWLTPLNPGGDLRGDLWPLVSESPVEPYAPWVVWSRFDGEHHQLAWATWSGRGWTPVEWVSDKRFPADEIDPSLAFDDDGRPFLAWWNDDGSNGQVYVSLFLRTQWLAPVAISPIGVDARYPDIRFDRTGRLTVRYETDAGTAEQTIFFSNPGTITDDINPQVQIRFSEPTLIDRNETH